MAIAYISHYECELHEMGAHHPERPERLGAISDRLLATGLEMAVQRYDAPEVSRDLLEAVHDSAHIDNLFQRSPKAGLEWLDGDTAMNPHTLQAALRAAGAGKLAVDLVMEGKVNRAFCGVRPPGHHAEKDKAMGFCFFNNIAVAARYALDHYALKRVAVVDFDVHHGNGTEHIFASDDRVLFCSTFQHPFYPFSGHNCDTPHIVNVPLPAGAGGKEFRAGVEQHWLPRLRQFQPELILVSAGFDAHVADDMSNMNLVDADYAWITRRLVEIAGESAEGRVVSMLEGGYELASLARSVEAHLKAYLGE